MRPLAIATLAALLAAACAADPAPDAAAAPATVQAPAPPATAAPSPVDSAEILVEAEAPLAREPADGTFARPHPARWASGRTCLIRFPGGERCLYALEVPAAGTWSVWLRYAAAGSPPVASGFVDADGAGELTETRLATTGGLAGKHAWRWARLFHGELAAGTHCFALGAAGIRPDCLLVTRAEGPPTRLAPPPAPARDAATLERIARPLAPAVPRWLDEVAGYELPAWYDGARVSLHTRLTDRMRDRPAFTGAAADFRALGVRTFVRHLKTAGEGAWWPSAVGPVEPFAAEADVARAVIERAHAAGCRLVAYYRHMEDAGTAERHPDWVCRDDRGEPYLGRRNHPRLCLASPYADFVELRLVELVARGVDGIYFDETHQPKTGCWCAWCRAAFRDATGLEHPETIDEEDPLFRKLQAFENRVMERTFLRWRRAVHAADPDVVLVIGNNLAPDFLDRHIDGRLMRLADAVKTEYDKGGSHRAEFLLADHPELRAPPRDVRLALGWTWCRDGAAGRPPHVWIPRVGSAEEALRSTAAVVAHGGVANLDHPEDTIPDPATFAAAIALGERAGAALAGTRPVRWCALHVPERALDRLAPDAAAAWRAVIGPVTGAFEALVRARLPVGTVSDVQLAAGELAGYAALVLLAPEDLTAEMQAAVARFEEAGGLVVRGREGGRWCDPQGFEDAAAELVAALAPARARVPVQVAGGPEDLHAVAHAAPTGERLVVALARGFGAVDRTPALAPLAPAAGVVVRLPRRPARVHELVGGTELEVRSIEDRFEVALPPFEAMAVIEVER